MINDMNSLLEPPKNNHPSFDDPTWFEGPLSAKTYKNEFKKDMLGIDVYTHCYTVGMVCKMLLLTKKLSKKTKKWLSKYIDLDSLPYFFSLHDIGKLSPDFQAMIRKFDIKENYIKHEVVSYHHLLNKYIPRSLARCILHHHGFYRLRDKSINSIKSDIGGKKWEILRDKELERLANAFGHSKNIEIKEEIPIEVLKFISGFLSFCDWITSDDKIFDPKFYSLDNLEDKINNAFIQYGIINDIDIEKPFPSFYDIFEFEPYDFQKDAFNAIKGSGLYIIEAPMGMGKTEAALYPALKLCYEGKADGIYFAMPTCTTSDKIHERMNKYIEKVFGKKQWAALIHGKAALRDVGVHNNVSGLSTWYKGNKRAILSYFGVGTIDQALLSVIPSVRYLFMRTFGLKGKVVIFDEAHSYDYYTNGILMALIRELLAMDCIVIILSATLTNNLRNELINCAREVQNG